MGGGKAFCRSMTRSRSFHKPMPLDCDHYTSFSVVSALRWEMMAQVDGSWVFPFSHMKS